MLALVVVLTAMVLLLGVLVVGLLRSHADIIRALHSLGVGVGDPAERSPAGHAHGGVDSPVALRLGPSLPAERSSSSVHDVEGVTPSGDAVVVSTATAGLTLLAFLSSGCSSCAAFWAALADPAQRATLAARVVVVTKGPEFESPDGIAAKTPIGITVVMSTAAWADYEVPGSPFFVLLDGATGTRVGEGVAQQLSQIADLVARAELDTRPPVTGAAVGMTGAEREAANDAQLQGAGIGPGHPSLYPRNLDDVFAATAGLGQGPGRRGGA
jgi:hypothetical protein